MEEIEKNNDDEISLIDLFAVLVRYRKMIITGTLASVFIVLFIFPTNIQNRTKHICIHRLHSAW